MEPINVRLFAANFTLLAAGEVVSKAFTFIAFAYLARQLGPSAFGGVEFALALIVLFTLVVEGGLSPYGAREVAKDPSALSRLASQIVALRSVLALGAFMLLLGVLVLLSVSWPVKQLLLLYGLTLFLTPVLLPWVFQGVDRMGVVAATKTIRWMVFAAGVFVWIREPAEVWRVPVLEMGALVCAAAFNLWMYRRFYGGLRPRLERNASFTIIREALPIGISQLLWAVRVYFPTIALGLLVGDRSVGWFGTAQRLVLAVNTFGVLYLFNLLPTLSRAAKQPKQAVQSIMRTSIPIVAWTTVFVGAAGTAFAEPLMGVVYGAQYTDGTTALRILIWLVPAALLAGHFRYILVAHDAQQLDLRSSAIGAGTCVVLTLFLVPNHGPVGAALAVLASELVTCIAAYLLVRRHVAVIAIGRHLAGPLLAGTLMVALVSVFPSPSLWLGGAAGILLYIATLVMLQPKMLADIRSVLARGL